MNWNILVVVGKIIMSTGEGKWVVSIKYWNEATKKQYMIRSS